MLKDQKGFTLIELLIVIAILGIMAAALIPNLVSFMANGEVGAANVELATVRTAAVAYQSEHDGIIPAGVLDNSIITIYISNKVKGIYTLDDKGVIISAQNGAWSNRIKWLEGEWVRN